MKASQHFSQFVQVVLVLTILALSWISTYSHQHLPDFIDLEAAVLNNNTIIPSVNNQYPLNSTRVFRKSPGPLVDPS